MLGVAGLLAMRGILTNKLPKPEVIDEVIQSHRRGLLFFTIATVLGAMWAADAWAATELGRKKPGR